MKTYKVSILQDVKGVKSLHEIATITADDYYVDDDHGCFSDSYSVEFFDLQENFWSADDHIPIAYFPPTEKWIVTS